MYVCLFSFSFLPVSCLSTRPWPRTVSKNACANNPQQPTNRKKRFPGEGDTFLLFSFTFSFFHLEASERAHARRESVQRRSAHASRRSIDEPTHEIANESKREPLMRYLRDIRLPDLPLSWDSFSLILEQKFLAFLSSLLPYTEREVDETNILIIWFPRNTRRDKSRRQRHNERTRYTSVRARRLIDHVRRRRRCRNKKTRQLVGFLMVFLRSRTTINYDLFLINSNSLPVKYNHYNYVCV